MIALLGWACTALILACYLATALKGRPAIFDWANVLLCTPMGLANYLSGAPFAAALSLAFGAIGLAGLIRRERDYRRIRRLNPRLIKIVAGQ